MKLLLKEKAFWHGASS